MDYALGMANCVRAGVHQALYQYLCQQRPQLDELAPLGVGPSMLKNGRRIKT
jgi:hypothetical protein